MHKPFWETMVDAAEVGHGTRLVDAGCGGGGASVLAAERGAQVSGLDAAEPLISIAQTRIPDGDFRTGDLETLPFEDEAFDAVIASNVLQYTEDRLATLRELRRYVFQVNEWLSACGVRQTKLNFELFQDCA